MIMSGNSKNNNKSKKDSSIAPLTLRFISGPNVNKEVVVDKEEMTIGRSKQADITIVDNLLSRIHCKISFKKSIGWQIEDLNSSNGTWLSGKQLKTPEILLNLLNIRIGQSLMEVEIGNTASELEESNITYSFDPESSLTSVEFDSKAEMTSEDIREEHKRLSVIYRVQNVLSTVFEEEKIYPKVLDAVLDVIEADYAYVLLYEEVQGGIKSMIGRDRKGNIIDPAQFAISDTVVSFVRKNKEAILSIDPPHDIRFATDTVIINKTNSVICVPILDQKNLLGMIYMASLDAGKELQEADLHLLAGVSYTTAMALVNSRLMQKNISNERMAALGSTAASLSHYIKNILTGIDGCLYLLRMGIDDNDPDLSNEAWGILSRNHKRLSSLVMDLLNLAKEQQLDIQTQNITEVITEATELVIPNLKKMGVEVTIDAEMRSNPLTAQIDSQAIHRVMLNLLSNSGDAVHAKYAGKPGGEIKISTKIVGQGDSMVISIVDNGCGIDADSIDSIFEMFYTGKGDAGTGLGLAVSKRLIEAHNGAIVVESELGVHTTFNLKLPKNSKGTKTEFINRN